MGRKKKEQPDFVYFGEEVAVIRAQDAPDLGAENVESFIGELLKMNRNALIGAEKQMGEALRIGWVFCQILGFDAPSSEADRDALERYGFKVNEMLFFDNPRQPRADGLHLISLASVWDVSDAIKWLASLYLMPIAQRNTEETIGQFTVDDANPPQYIKGTVKLPALFKYESPFVFDSAYGEVQKAGEQMDCLSYVFRTARLMSTFGWEDTTGGWLWHSPTRETDIAMMLLECLLNTFAKPGYYVHYKDGGFGLRQFESRTYRETLIRTFADMAEAGKIAPCLGCGKPLARLTDGATQWCAHTRCRQDMYDELKIDAAKMPLEELLAKYAGKTGEDTIRNKWKVAHGEVVR